MNFGLRVQSRRILFAFAAMLVFSSPFTGRPVLAQSSEQIETSLNIWERQLIQEGLILLGFYNGFADGSFGSNTRNAVSSYQSQNNKPATGRLSPQDVLELSGAALDLRKQLQWRSLDNSLSDVTISYPAGVLTQREQNKLGGENLQTVDGHLLLKTIRFPNSGAPQFETLYNSLLNEQGSTVTYQLKRSNWFIVSGTAGNRRFYSRFEQRNNEIRGYDFSWNDDNNSKPAENISVLISNSFYPFGGDPAGGNASYPTLMRLADLAAPKNQEPSSSDNGTVGQSTGSGGQSKPGTISQTAQADSAEGLTEQKEGALPPPSDGSMVTSDGKGLRFVYHYFPPKNPELDYAYKWATDTHLFLNIPEIDALDGIFVIPRQLRYVTRQCDTVNAFYDRKNGAIFLCYEMIDGLLQMGKALSKGAADPEKLTVEFVRNNLRFILLHESGHALIDLLDLPAVGREEDSVDQLAAVLLLMNVSTDENKNDIARVLQLASVWFKVNSQLAGSPDVTSFADEHSLDAQRYFNLLCIVYGKDPENNRGMVERGMLPKERAARCPDESAKISRSWARLIVPHFSPRFQPKSEDAASRRDSSPSKSTPANPLEWDGKSNPFSD